MTITYTKILAHGYTYWTIQVDGHPYRENGQKRLFSTKKDAELYTLNHINRGTETRVNGLHFQVWSDFGYRCTTALCIETGEAKTIHSSGYIHKDLSVRKAIATVYGLPTFRTEATEAKKVLTEEQKVKKAARAKARREARKAAQTKV